MNIDFDRDTLTNSISIINLQLQGMADLKINNYSKVIFYFDYKNTDWFIKKILIENVKNKN